MKICFIIGTRPQYIKFKSIYDYLVENKCNFFTIDTNQHYSNNMSKSFIEEFNLKIDYNLYVENINSIDFISKTIVGLEKILSNEKPSFVVVMGDTNTTLAGSLTANKMGLYLAHIEAGMRCGDKNRPEEINRIVTDILSDIHFISRKEDNINVSNPVYTGDLEFVLLKQICKNIDKKEIKDFIFMTIHRDENVNINRIKYIFKECELSKENFVFPLHHRTKNFISKNNIVIPKNIKIIQPLTYMETVNMMLECKAIFSDSGGILKTSPFFGKRCLVPLNCTEYNDLIKLDYAKLGIDFNWLIDSKIERNEKLYYLSNCCEIIYKSLNKL